MNTTVWLIQYSAGGGSRRVVHTHNAVADYRDVDPDATATPFDIAAVAELVEASRPATRYNAKLTRDETGRLIAAITGGASHG